MNKFSARKYNAFTLIELLVVIGILAILLTIVLIAINPARQFAQSNNTRRRSDINTILNAIHQYSVDQRGNIVALNIPQEDADPLTNDAIEIMTEDAGTPGAEPDICALLVPTYVSALPVDPQVDGGAGMGVPISDCTVAYSTGYEVVRSNIANNIRITVRVMTPEAPETLIEITR